MTKENLTCLCNCTPYHNYVCFELLISYNHYWLLFLHLHRDDAKNPGFWSRICVQNMAKLAKEGTTVRRVLESLFRYFDNANLWSPEHGLALSVLLNMQSIIENSGICFLECFNISFLSQFLSPILTIYNSFYCNLQDRIHTCYFPF